jgi:hypothetical protein
MIKETRYISTPKIVWELYRMIIDQQASVLFASA